MFKNANETAIAQSLMVVNTSPSFHKYTLITIRDGSYTRPQIRSALYNPKPHSWMINAEIESTCRNLAVPHNLSYCLKTFMRQSAISMQEKEYPSICMLSTKIHLMSPSSSGYINLIGKLTGDENCPISTFAINHDQFFSVSNRNRREGFTEGSFFIQCWYYY